MRQRRRYYSTGVFLVLYHWYINLLEQNIPRFPTLALLSDSIWTKLVRRTLSYSNNTHHWDEKKLEEEIQVTKARLVAQLLKMASDPKSPQLDLR